MTLPSELLVHRARGSPAALRTTCRVRLSVVVVVGVVGLLRVTDGLDPRSPQRSTSLLDVGARQIEIVTLAVTDVTGLRRPPRPMPASCPSLPPSLMPERISCRRLSRLDICY